MSSSKKLRERLFVEHFRAAYSDFPEGDIFDSESPDFLIYAYDRTVGIEIVEFFRGQSSQGSALHQEVLRKRFTKAAQQQYVAVNNMPVLVTLSWSANRQLSKRIVPDLAAYAARLVAQWTTQLAQDEEYGELKIGWESLQGTPLEDLLNYIKIRRFPGAKTFWSTPEAGFIGVSASELQAIISSHDAKVDKYLEHCDSVWLLIVSEGYFMASTLSWDEDVVRHAFDFKFNRVFIYDFQDHRVQMLARDSI